MISRTRTTFQRLSQDIKCETSLSRFC